MDKNDVFIIIKALMYHLESYEYDIAHNRQYSKLDKQERIRANQDIVYDVINKLIESDKNAKTNKK